MSSVRHQCEDEAERLVLGFFWSEQILPYCRAEFQIFEGAAAKLLPQKPRASVEGAAVVLPPAYASPFGPLAPNPNGTRLT